MKGWSLRLERLRPTLLLMLVATIPVLVAAVVIGQYFLIEQRQSFERQLTQGTELAAKTLARELQFQVELLSLITESPQLDPPINRRAFRELAERVNDRNPMWEAIYVSDPDGDILLSLPASRAAGVAAKIQDRESHDTAVNEQKAVVGSIVRDERGLVTFPIRMAVKRNKVSYVLNVQIRPEVITSALFENSLPSSWIAWIVDGQGRLVTASQVSPSLLGGPAIDFVRSADDPDNDANAQLANGIELKTDAAAIVGSNWTVHIGIPAQEYLDVGQSRYRLLIAAIVLAVVLLGIAAVLLQREVAARWRQDASVSNMQRMDALGKLTGGVAHDFNNLLMIFQAGIEGLKRRRNDEKRYNLTLEMMTEGVAKGKAITERLLSFSRETERDAEIVFIQDRTEVLRQLVKQAVRDEVLIEMRLDPDMWPVSIAPQSLEIALINLVTNAREAMPDGGTIRIEGRNIADSYPETGHLKGPAVALTVADNGTGIKAADLHRVFEPFFTTKSGKASGLGLSQVYGFARRSGGLVTARSVEGRGASFTIYLPRVIAERDERPSLASDPSALPSRVLVVDDTPSSLEACRMSLELEGVVVSTASSGAEALNFLSADSSIPLVLSDIMMPNMSGLELAEKLQVLHPQVAIVLMTGYSDALEKGLKTDRPIVKKPFTKAELLAAVSAANAAVQTRGTVIKLHPA